MKPSVEKIEAGIIVAVGAAAAGAAIYEGARFANQLVHGQDKDQEKEVPSCDVDDSQNSGDGSILLTEGVESIIQPRPEPTIPYILL